MTTNTATAPKTQRRSAKLTQPARGYVAIHCDYIAAATTRIACVAKVDMTIKGSNGASVSLKAGEAFWLVRSESLGDNWFYVVREVSGEKKCSCPANKPCKHEVALKAHLAEHSRPAIHLRATERRAEISKVAAVTAVDEAEVVRIAAIAHQAKHDAEAQRQAELDAAKTLPNYEPAKSEALRAASIAASAKRTSAPLARVGFSLYR